MEFIGGIPTFAEFWEHDQKLYAYKPSEERWLLISLENLVDDASSNRLTVARHMHMYTQGHKDDIRRAFVNWFKRFTDAAQALLGVPIEQAKFSQGTKIVPDVIPLSTERTVNNVIYKTTVEVHGLTQGIKVKKDSRLLHLAMQNGAPTLWFMCYPGAIDCYRKVVFYGTGHEFEASDAGEYIGTVQVPSSKNSELVLHLFDLGEA